MGFYRLKAAFLEFGEAFTKPRRSSRFARTVLLGSGVVLSQLDRWTMQNGWVFHGYPTWNYGNPWLLVKGSSAHGNPGHMYTQRPFSSLTVTCARKWRSHVHTSETHGHMYTQVRSSAHASDGHMYTHVIVTRGHMYTPLLWIWGGEGW